MSPSAARPAGRPEPRKHRPAGRIVRGSAWMIAMRLGIRCIGLVSTVFLARLLTLPSDFGIVAIAMLVISLFEVFGETGQQYALIRHEDPVRAHYDSAWTMTLLVNTCLTVLILMAAPAAGAYFKDHRVVAVIHILSLRVFRRQRLCQYPHYRFSAQSRFRSESFRFGLIRKIATFITTMTVFLRSR